MKHPIAILLVSAFFLTGLQIQAHHLINPLTSDAALYTNPAPKYTGTYSGTVPCADCKGISIELTLKEDGKAKKKTFTLSQKFIGKANNTSTLTGIWFLATGNKQNPKAKILQLIPNGNDDLIYFEIMQNGSIKLLDRRQNPINSKLNYTLKKQRT